MDFNQIDVYIKVTTGLIAVAYPILFQIISKLDDKYASIKIIKLFEKEIEPGLFKWSLITAVFFILIWSLDLKPLPIFEKRNLNFFINHSANILVYLSTIVLVISFFLFVEKIRRYYTPSRFVSYLEKKHNEKGKKSLEYFEALSDVFLHAINKQNEGLALTITRFFYNAFIIENQSNSNAEFRQPFYSIINKAIDELLHVKNDKLSIIKDFTIGGMWFLGRNSEISELTFSWLWSNLFLAVKYENDDMILLHWKSAHQYMSFRLEPVQPKNDSNFKITNKQAIDKRNEERNRFLEFHYALGGLLLYNNRYKCISRIFKYTTSQPPRYELLPSSMDAIFEKYITLNNTYTSWVSDKYNFVEYNDINSQEITIKWVSSYLSILFLRQYTLIHFLIFNDPMARPIIPKLQNEKTRLLSILPYFTKLLKENIENSLLLKEIGLNNITREYCHNRRILYPFDFLDDFKKQIESEYEFDAANQIVDSVKLQHFFDSSNIVLEKTLNEYIEFHNNANVLENYLSWYISGQQTLESKDVFSENPEITLHNWDNFLATQIASHIKEQIANTFLINNTQTYLLKPQIIFDAIDNLGIDETYVIICFGISIEYYISILKVRELNTNRYKKTKIIAFQDSKSIYNSFFVLKQCDIPTLNFNNIQKNDIDKYELTKINDKFEIYASVIDLNNASPKIIKELSQNNEEWDFKKSVFLTIMLSAEIRWKKNIKLIQLIEYSEYRQQGSSNNLNDIVRL